ncbi:hypothetical protein C9J12_27015 [Photobacterium frigidiphilum]|uniref:Uncharacterized protein n=1 Tax=Photobacterium frigidiphilum TaxID=264736 RepID=A0A2T3J752_9GAMM|nr:hypothetical protein [Photobacterium frigidiphilum]PSU44524.1 hypothetical protein C9J12_27015 [Photobacterium frigidiphilum]
MTASKRKHPKNQSSKTVSVEQKRVSQRITLLGSKKNSPSGKALFTHYHKRFLLAFSQFIDNPHCHSKKLHDLHFCQSVLKGLQERQRISCVKVMTAIFCFLETQSLQVGVGKVEHMDTVTHDAIRRMYVTCWDEAISETRYFATLKLFKMADFLVVDAVFVSDRDVLDNLDLLDDDLPKIYSKAAYKSITQKFMNVFSHLFEQDDVKDSFKKGIAKRIKAGLSNVWIVYEAFSNSYFRKKRNRANLKRGDEARYPQGKAVEPSIYGANYLSEH